MRFDSKDIRKGVVCILFVMIVTWASHLIYTKGYFSVYALCAAVSSICLYDNYCHQRKPEKLSGFLNLILSSLLSLAATLGNYEIFQRVRNLEEISYSTNQFMNIFEVVLTFLCGIVVFYQIFLCLVNRFPVTCEEKHKLPSGKHIYPVFFGVFGSLSVIYLVYLFFVVYPGNVTSDSIWQISMIRNNAYSNHHPYWHTMSIRWCMELGYWLFGNYNAGAATYSFFQSLLMAACFGYTVVTLYQYQIPKVWILLTYGCFAILPHHITYSCTVWKDVPFGLAMLAFVVSVFRIMRHVGKNRVLNYILFMISGIGACIMRTNGLAAMAAAFIMLVLFFWKKCKNMVLPWLIILVAGWFLTSPALKIIGIYNDNLLEGLSVPLQQVSRVIANGGELTEEEIRMIDTILDIDRVAEEYTEECCDPIKELIRAVDFEYKYLHQHKAEFLKLWIDIGMRYPWEYVEAWVEETKGYWNGGYDYYIYAQYVSENNYGISLVKQDNIIHTLMKAYFTLTRETVLFEPIQSIGLNVWVLSFLCFLSMAWGRREFLLTMPVVAVVFTLWLTTPVFSEFRYAYCVFTTLPFILPVSLYKKAGEEK